MERIFRSVEPSPVLTAHAARLTNFETTPAKGYSQILFEFYLSVKLTDNSIDDAGIFPLLSEYISNEKDNAIPLYFMSYYYARKQNFHTYDER